MMTPAAQLAEVRRLLASPGGSVHLVGIGGIGMAGVAFHLAQRGLCVHGCDVQAGRMMDWVRSHGIAAITGHDPRHVEGSVGWVVRSSAVPRHHPELVAASARNLPILDRGIVLAGLLEGYQSVAIAGTHGKTTTTAMVTQILRAANPETAFCIGGEVPTLGGPAGVGRHYFVAESDESDGTLASVQADVAVITNIEPEHLDHFGCLDRLVECFSTFAKQARRRVIFNADSPMAARLGRELPHATSFGESSTADVQGRLGQTASIPVHLDVLCEGQLLGRLNLPIPGRHNAMNALAACAVGLEWGVPFEVIRDALARFHPVRRRFECVVDRGGIRVISDYAHHPTEIRALVETACAQKASRLLAVFQPHRYSRTRGLAAAFPTAFEGVDLLLLLPVYAASEKPLEGGTADDLRVWFERHGQTVVRMADSQAAAWNWLRGELRAGDLLLVVGAGDVDRIAMQAAAELQGC